jgi:hypothetical protein
MRRQVLCRSVDAEPRLFEAGEGYIHRDAGEPYVCVSDRLAVDARGRIVGFSLLGGGRPL